MNDVKKQFGEQLSKYRTSATLTQEEYASFRNTSKSYISNLENGNINIQIESMEEHASSFGVKHYQLSNPDYPIPSLEEMPSEIQTAATKAKKGREEKAKEKQEQKGRTGSAYKTGKAKELHELVDAGFFNEKRTSKEAFLELNTNLSDNELTNDHKQEIGKITSTLSKGKFKKKLAKIKSASGETAVRFIAREHMREGDRASEIK